MRRAQNTGCSVAVGKFPSLSELQCSAAGKVGAAQDLTLGRCLKTGALTDICEVAQSAGLSGQSSTAVLGRLLTF